MFRLRSKSNKNSTGPLLSLALKDKEWVAEKSATSSVDHKSKVISTPIVNGYQKGLGYRIHKLVAVVDAKYGSPRKFVNVKHMLTEIKIAERMATYWYVTKKAGKYINANWENERQTFRNSLLTHSADNETEKLLCDYVASNFANGFINNNLDLANIAYNISKYPGGLEFITLRCPNSYMRIAIANVLTERYGKSYDDGQMDSSFMSNTFVQFQDIIEYAYHNIMGTRKDSKLVSNKTIKTNAQYMYDKFKLIQQVGKLPSEQLADLNIEVDGQGVLTGDDMEELQYHTKEGLVRSSHKTAKWSQMDIVRPKLVERLPVKLQSTARKKSDRGVTPKSMHRYTTDKKIFSNKTKRDGGTVLIDASGSMDFTEEDIKELVYTLPASTVAMYCGDDHHELDYTYWKDTDTKPLGHLYILAENGKYVGDIPEHPAQNLCDGPAFDWLGKQPEPRIVVTDMQVSGIRETRNGFTTTDFGDKMALDALKKVKEYNLIPIPTVDKAKEWVKAYKNN
jgi:hypothetical protein